MKKDTAASNSLHLAGKIATGASGRAASGSMSGDTASDRSFQGTADFDSQRQLVDQMMVTVVDILPNGNLVIEGYRRRLVQSEVRLLRVSGIVRHYLVHACGLPAGERTTTELCRELDALPRLEHGLTDSIAVFLHRCDERKFSPEPPTAPAPAVVAALEIVARVEAHNRELAQAAPTPPPAAGVAAASS